MLLGFSLIHAPGIPFCCRKSRIELPLQRSPTRRRAKSPLRSKTELNLAAGDSLVYRTRSNRRAKTEIPANCLYLNRSTCAEVP